MVAPYVLSKKEPQQYFITVDSLCFLFGFREHILANSTKRTNKVFGKILKFGAGSNSVIGIADCFIVFPAASITYVFQTFVSFLEN